jgi:hypothetical protein
VTTVRVTYIRGESKREIIVTSAYLPFDSDEPPPSEGLGEVIDYCSRHKLQLIVGCDANAHHIIWGSMDINPQGECLMEYLVSTNLNILKKGKEPTFVVSNRKTMKKLEDRHIRDEILGLHPVHRYQFAYQPGKSTETALHHVITHIEEAVENREVTLGAFLDIEGAFDSTSFDIITNSMGLDVLLDRLHAG